MSAVRTSYFDWATREGHNDLSFHAEDRVRDSGGEDPADLHIAYERAKADADRQAEAFGDRLDGEPEYRVHVRVVRTQREASA